MIAGILFGFVVGATATWLLAAREVRAAQRGRLLAETRMFVAEKGHIRTRRAVRRVLEAKTNAEHRRALGALREVFGPGLREDRADPTGPPR